MITARSDLGSGGSRRSSSALRFLHATLQVWDEKWMKLLSHCSQTFGSSVSSIVSCCLSLNLGARTFPARNITQMRGRVAVGGESVCCLFHTSSHTLTRIQLIRLSLLETCSERNKHHTSSLGSFSLCVSQTPCYIFTSLPTSLPLFPVNTKGRAVLSIDGHHR